MMKEETYQISGMHCAACATRIERVLNREAAIEEATVNLVMEKATVKYNPKQIDRAAIFEKISNIGFEAHEIDKDNHISKREHQELKKQRNKFLLSALLALPLLYTMFAHFTFLDFIPVPELLMHPLFQLALATPIQFILGGQFYFGAWRALKNKSANMDVLVAMGTSAAYFYSFYMMILHQGHPGHVPLYFETSAVLITLILLGKYFEKRAKGHASDAIKKLAALQVKDALVEKHGEVVNLSIDQIQVGDIIHIKSGTYIPLDAEIIAGSTSINESMITGESIPVDKTIGDSIIGSTLNQANFIKARVTHVGDDLVLNQIIKVVEEAQTKKPQIQRLADKISNIFVPTVVGIALFAFLLWFFILTSFDFTRSLEIFIAVIVIACPCALGLATPTSIMVGSGRAAESGILFKSAESLEQTRQIDTIVFDKTGTLTKGAPEVVDTIEFERVPHIDDYIKSLESQSEHPLSHALVSHFKDAKNVAIKNYETHIGNGISGMIDGSSIRIGSLSFIASEITLTEDMKQQQHQLESKGATVIGVQIKQKLAMMIALRDEPKPKVKETIRQLRQHYEVVMLSGDSQMTVEAIARELGIQRTFANVKPNEKAKIIETLQEDNHKVMMVGDGINDAPSLIQSDIGIAMGSGTDIAIESSDVALVYNHISQIPEVLKLSELTIKNIKQNLFFAFCYNIIGIPIAAAGFLAPWVAGTAMAFSSVSVVLNALRLKRIQK
ncbi:copper-translocating P-type ATPase [Staphylococcus agnetis]|uniref:P-type Cu(+) transporter n=2 Tax=Staphylococcus agnetis TaxID=985762 RepID=A0ABX3Z1K0_9STAP|nr:copper-translocating P-type ATPase [Staphylococcus agnetis]OSP22802.1 copper-translocating P-type ATPase [Staphylococcus agnetis]OTW30775.1 copper-translocating P-type ATPase [Staphylococcus agnetis]